MRSILASSFALCVLGAVATAQATPTLNLKGLALANTGTLGLSGPINGTYSAGPFNASLSGGADMRVFCADLDHSAVYNSAMGVTLLDTSTMGAGHQKAARLFNKYSPLVGNDSAMNAALQGAIWKSIYPTLTLSGGNAALATTYFNDATLSSYSNQATYYDFGGTNQSMIGGMQAVPEPASMIALGAGAVGLLRRRRKA